jgi:hypothetical protein
MTERARRKVEEMQACAGHAQAARSRFRCSGGTLLSRCSVSVARRPSSGPRPDPSSACGLLGMTVRERARCLVRHS